MASTRPITFTDKIGINKIIAAKINIEALVTVEEALIEGTIKDK